MLSLSLILLVILLYLTFPLQIALWNSQNAGKRKNATGYVKRIYAKEQLKRYHGDRNHLKRNKLTIVANNKNSTFDRNYEGQTLSCYIISYLIHAIFQDILCILRK